ncbi:MAG: hypothetical protein VKO39_07330 [Cyanobacteriota bacterium]|nr:hypothetical protein [Cyanobacteriota bacterium]
MTSTHHPLWFGLIALGQLGLAALALTRVPDGAALAGAMAGVIGLGLGLDNAVLAAGAPLLARGRLEPCSRWRYRLHGLITPLLLPLSLAVASRGALALPTPLLALGWAVALVWIAANWWLGFRHLDLALVRKGALVRHHNRDRHGQPWLRLALLLLVLVILSLGLLTPQAAVAWPLRLGSGAMLAGAIMARPLGLALANLGELALMGGFSLALMG